MNSFINLVTKRKDIVFLCESLLPSYNFNVVGSNSPEILKNELKKLPDAVIDASVFENTDQFLIFIKALSPQNIVFLIATEVHPNVLNLINNDCPHVFHFPCNIISLECLLKNAMENRVSEKVLENLTLNNSPVYGFFSGNSTVIKKVREQILLASKLESPVLLLGDTGTGKTTAGKLIYYMSHRNQKKFILKSIPSITESLLESELFGIKKGTCTGVDYSRDGILMSAQGGVLFLDEIGTASIKQQKTLLSILDSGTFTKVGCNEKEELDIRWIFGTNIKIKESLVDGSFCPDLFYRINSNTIEIPPLRAHKEDIPFLAERYLLKSNKSLSSSAIEKIMDFDWPGNVRQLNTCLEKSKNKSSGEFITESDIDLEEIEN